MLGQAQVGLNVVLVVTKAGKHTETAAVYDTKRGRTHHRHRFFRHHFIFPQSRDSAPLTSSALHRIDTAWAKSTTQVGSLTMQPSESRGEY
jgi:hypothetical protein